MKEKLLDCVKVLIVGYGLCFALGMGTRNIYPCILALVWYVIDKSIANKASKDSIAITVLAVCYSLATTLYKACNAEIAKGLGEHLFGLLAMFVGLTFIWNTIVKYIWDKVSGGEILRKNSLKSEDGKRISVSVFAIIFGALAIRLLLDYPGDVSNDSIGIIQQALYDYIMHGGFPPILAIIMRWCIDCAKFCGGDINFGIFLYCLFQILIFSYVATEIVCRIMRHGINKYYCYLIIAYFAIIPFNIHFSHTVWKDTPFAFSCVLFMLLIWEQTMKTADFKSYAYWRDVIAIIISGIAMAILRANGYYALLLCIPCGFILFWKNRKDVCVIYLILLVLTKLVMGPLNDKIISDNNIKVYELASQRIATESSAHNESEETTSVDEYIPSVEEKNVSKVYGQSGLYIITSQQLAAVYMNDESISPDEEALLNEVFKVDQLKKTYTPYISDHTLYSLNRIDRQRYLDIWWKIGTKHPLVYIKAWGDMTCGYWYPEVKERNVYIDDLKENDYGIKRGEVLPSAFYRIKEKVDRLYTRIPFYGLFWSIGFVVWVTAFCVAKTIVIKGWRQALCYMPLIGAWATLLVATPVYGEFRYLYSVFFALPIIIVLPFVDNN